MRTLDTLTLSIPCRGYVTGRITGGDLWGRMHHATVQAAVVATAEGVTVSGLRLTDHSARSFACLLTATPDGVCMSIDAEPPGCEWKGSLAFTSFATAATPAASSENLAGRTDGSVAGAGAGSVKTNPTTHAETPTENSR